MHFMFYVSGTLEFQMEFFSFYILQKFNKRFLDFLVCSDEWEIFTQTFSYQAYINFLQIHV